MALRVLEIKEQKGPDMYPAKHYICDKGCFGWICYEDKVYLYFRSKRIVMEHWISEYSKFSRLNSMNDVKDFLKVIEYKLGKGVAAMILNDFTKLQKELQEEVSTLTRSASLALSLLEEAYHAR